MTTTYILDIESEEYISEILMRFEDNGDWGYLRWGMGKDKKGLYMVDLDDSGERGRLKFRIRKELSAEDVIRKGVGLGIFDIDGINTPVGVRLNWESEVRMKELINLVK